MAIQEWGYSWAEMNDGIDALWKQIHSDPVWKSFQVADIVGVDVSHPGIAVEGEPIATTGLTPAATARLEMNLASSAEKATSLPVHVVPGVETHLAATMTTTRNTDVAPYIAGGFMYDLLSGGGCSSGFSIIYPGNILGKFRITTARHCPSNSYVAYDSRGNYYGNGIATANPGQARVLSNSGVAGAFIAGPGSNQAYHVTELIDVDKNSYVCTSGGNSGIHCNIKVTNLTVSLNDGYGAQLTIRGDQRTNGAIAVESGDSGGPVFGLISGTENVQAIGMIQASTGTLYGRTSPDAHCLPARVQALCGSAVLFTSERTILNDLNAQLDTA